MNRKNTILAAVILNAGIIAVLLVAALTTQEDAPAAPTLMGDSIPSFPAQEKPMFEEPMPSAPLGLQTPVEAAPPMAVMPAPSMVEPAPEPFVHKLPQPAVEEKPQAPAKHEPMTSKEVVVKKGDSLEKIARAHRVTVDDLIRSNRLTGTMLKAGQVLKIPSGKHLAASSVKTGGGDAGYYTIKVGDNPWSIAMKHHIKVEELLRLNGLNEEKARKLKPGDRLRIR